MRFEVGKFYRHITGDMVSIIGRITTTLYGETLLAESTGRQPLVAVGSDEYAARNWREIPEDEWLAAFSVGGGK